MSYSNLVHIFVDGILHTRLNLLASLNTGMLGFLV